MSHSDLKQLTKAEELFDAGKLDKALELLDDLDKLEELDPQQKDIYQLKGLVLMYQSKHEEVIKFGVRISKEGQKFNDNLQIVDGLTLTAMGLMEIRKWDDALEYIEKAEEFLKSISHITHNELLQRSARLLLTKGTVYFGKANLEMAQKCFEHTINLQKELGNTMEIVWAYSRMARIMYQGLFRFDLTIEYAKKALSLAEDIKFNHFWIAMSHIQLGNVYGDIGEFEQSLKHAEKGLKIFKEIKNKFLMAISYSNLGAIYAIIGDYEVALKNLQESLLLFESQSIGIEGCLTNIISVAFLKDDIEFAQPYYNRLENLYHQKKDTRITLLYQVSTALMLIKSSRIRDKAKAEELLKQIIENETIAFDLTISAVVLLCDLLLSEFRQNNNIEVLDELNQYISKLLNLAEKSHSYLVFGEAFKLQAKLALTNLDLKSARRYLTQAQKIAESYGIKRLAIDISNEHDELLRQTKLWENLKESEASIAERMKLARIYEQMDHMVKKKGIEVPDLSDEEPLLLLIVSESGEPIFSHSFIEDQAFEDDLFGSFFSAINSFINEKFSEGLDRASFGEHTLLTNNISPFLLFYVYKGQSYLAQQRIRHFIEKIQNDEPIWQKINKFYQVNIEVQIKDIPSLEPLITEVFIEKNIPLNV